MESLQMAPQKWCLIQYIGFFMLVLGSVILFHTTTAQPQTATPTSPLAPGTFRLAVTGDTVSLEAQAASVAAILTEMGHQAGITMHISRLADKTLTLHFDRVPLREALTRLAKNVAMVTAQGPNALPHGIAAVYVLAAGEARSPQKAQERPPPGETTQEPTSRPAPFQFMFDPSQHVKQP